MTANRKTVTVNYCGSKARAYAEHLPSDGIAEAVTVVRVYDDVAGHYTACHSLTPAQIRYVIGRTLPRAA